jgi:hypothetical protein
MAARMEGERERGGAVSRYPLQAIALVTSLPSIKYHFLKVPLHPIVLQDGSNSFSI